MQIVKLANYETVSTCRLRCSSSQCAAYVAEGADTFTVVDEDATLSDIAMTVILPVAPGFARTITVSLNRHQEETLSRFHE